MITPKTHRRKRPAAGAWILSLPIVAGLLFAPLAGAQTPQPAHAPDALHQLNDSVEALVQRVSPTVVQILVSGYSSTEDTGQGQMSVVVGKQRTIGSGVIVDPEGYIVTNAHVVAGARARCEVIAARARDRRCRMAPTPSGVTADQTIDARIVGVATARSISRC